MGSIPAGAAMYDRINPLFEYGKMRVEFIDDSLPIPDDKKEAIDRDQRTERSRKERKAKERASRYPRLFGETRPLDK